MITESKPRMVVGAIIVDSLDRPARVAAARRIGPVDLAGYWEVPRGKLEAGETAEDALVRELDEELSIKVLIGDEHSDQGGPWRISALLELRLFFVEIIRGGLASGPVHDAVTWLEPENIAAVAWPPADAGAVAAPQRALMSSEPPDGDTPTVGPT